MEVVAKTFIQLWRSTEGFKMRKLDDHLVLFVFKKKEDLEQVFHSEPWCFDKHLVVLQRYDQDVLVNDLKFDRATFWIQVHDIPIRYMSREVAESICDIVGEVCRSIGGVEEDGGRFMRVKVTLDTSLPLCHGRLITLGNGNKHWVSFKYECFSNICYWCGRLDHDNKNCALWIQSKGSLIEKDKQYSHMLRASPYRSYNKPVVFVPGFYESVFNPRMSFGGTENAQVTAEVSGPSPPTELNPVMEMDTHKEIINVDVNLHASSARFDGELMNVILPKNTGTFANDDPFLAKLQEIDRDVKKFDHVPCENPSDLIALASCLDGLVSIRGKVEKEGGNPLLVGPQVNEPILPISDVDRPTSRPPL
ncbi:hypothetical protein SO802_021312 [Lithocarpus litseifolius]|uniref:DUF4283 domain-containing protein n=1 Tax=Lithocarpus litseifolius TaxID=425828 RepID=A0AAW2CFX0_9ROSI